MGRGICPPTTATFVGERSPCMAWLERTGSPFTSGAACTLAVTGRGGEGVGRRGNMPLNVDRKMGGFLPSSGLMSLAVVLGAKSICSGAAERGRKL